MLQAARVTSQGMASIFVSGDTHFGHEEALALFSRPFRDVDAMDDAMVSRLNDRMGRKDTLIHIGDFCGPADWGKRSVRRRGAELRAAIRCRRIILIRGNHDPRGVRAFDRLFDEVHDLLTFRLRDGGRERISFCHYPLRLWQGCFKGAMLAYGHAHGTLPELDRSTDVGVDCWGFSPIELGRLAKLLRQRPVEVPSQWPRRQALRAAEAPVA